MVGRQSHTLLIQLWEGVLVCTHAQMRTTRVAVVTSVVFGASARATHTGHLGHLMANPADFCPLSDLFCNI